MCVRMLVPYCGIFVCLSIQVNDWFIFLQGVFSFCQKGSATKKRFFKLVICNLHLWAGSQQSDHTS